MPAPQLAVNTAARASQRKKPERVRFIKVNPSWRGSKAAARYPGIPSITAHCRIDFDRPRLDAAAQVVYVGIAVLREPLRRILTPAAVMPDEHQFTLRRKLAQTGGQ